MGCGGIRGVLECPNLRFRDPSPLPHPRLRVIWPLRGHKQCSYAHESCYSKTAILQTDVRFLCCLGALEGEATDRWHSWLTPTAAVPLLLYCNSKWNSNQTKVQAKNPSQGITYYHFAMNCYLVSISAAIECNQAIT